MTPETFDFVRTLLRDQAAIVLDDNKRYLVESRLSPLAADERLSGIDELADHVRRDSNGPLAARMIDAMTTNETFFFRDRTPFELLRNTLIPEMLERSGRHSRHSVWSAACSSGQEPYSFAMMVEDSFPEGTLDRFRIVATDVSGQMLDRASQARYSQLEVERGLSDDLRERFFDPVGDQWQLRESIRNRVTFQPLNLIDQWPAMAPVDILFLRNVLVYFDMKSRKEILGKVHSVLAPDGILLLGGSETTFGVDERFERVLTEYCSYYRLTRG